MKSTFKLAASAGMLLAGCLTMSTMAVAAPPHCPDTQNIDAFIAQPCIDIDKLYTYISDTLPNHSNIAVEVDNFSAGGIDAHNFSVNPSTPITAAGIYTWNYTIEITDPLKVFRDVSMDSDVPNLAPDVLITKVIDLDANTGNGSFGSLTSLSGNPSASLFLPPNTTKLWVYETVRIDQGDAAGSGALNSFTNTFTQQQAPEPATLALLGLGLAGLGFARRRKQS